MALIDKIKITYTETGKQRIMTVGWLMSQDARWHFQAKAFMITDRTIVEKMRDCTFNGQDFEPQMLMRYPYIKTLIDEVEDPDPGQYREPEPPKEEAKPIEQHKEEVVDEPIKQETEPFTIESIEACEDVSELKKFLESNGVKYDKRKKKLDYFQQLSIETIK